MLEELKSNIHWGKDLFIDRRGHPRRPFFPIALLSAEMSVPGGEEAAAECEMKGRKMHNDRSGDGEEIAGRDGGD